MMTSPQTRHQPHQGHPNQSRAFRFTGWHMTGILVACFGIVIAVNVYMAHLAISTFSGLVVENSYDASQKFNTWLDEGSREKALGWSATTTRNDAGHLAVRIAGKGTDDAALKAEAWRPLGGHYALRELTFTRNGDMWMSQESLAPGRWNIKLEITASGHQWRSIQHL